VKKLFACLIVLVCLVLTAFEEPKSAATALRWKLAKGQVLRYRSEMKQEQKTGDTVLTTRIDTVYRYEVRSVSSDGRITIDVTHEAIRVWMDGPTPVDFDSTRKGEAAKLNDPEFSVIFAPLIDVHASLEMDPSGKISGFKGMTEAVAKVVSSLKTDKQRELAEGVRSQFEDDSLRQTLEYNVFPTKTLAVDSHWARKVEFAATFGNVTVDYDYTLKGVEARKDGRVADIGVQAKTKIEKDPKAEPVGVGLRTTGSELTGSMSFAVDTGRMTHLEVDSSISLRVILPGPPEMEIESESSMHQVVALLAADAPAFE
jgi:hypothetical protein